MSESGRSFEELKPSLDYFVRKIGEAKDPASEAAKTFRDLGVSVTDMNGNVRPTGDILREVQQELSEAGSVGERSLQSFQLFGKGSARAIDVLLSPMDQLIAKAREAGTIGPEMEARARAADTAFEQLKTTWDGFVIRQQVGSAEVGTSFANMAKDVIKWLDSIDAKLRKDYRLEVGIRTKSEQAELFRSLGIDVPKKFAYEGVTGTPSGQVQPAVDKAAADLKKSFDELVAAVKNGTVSIDEAMAQLGKAGRFAEQGRILDLATERPDLLGHGFIGPELPPGFMSRRESLYGDLREKSVYSNVPVSQRDIKLDLTDNKEKVKALGKTLESTFASFTTDAILGIRSMSDAMKSFLETAAGIVIEAGIKAILPFSKGGTVIGLAGGGTIPSNDYPVLARTGLVIGPTSGVDSVPLLAMPGETFVSRDTTNRLDAFLNQALSNRPTEAAQSTLEDRAPRIRSGARARDPLSDSPEDRIGAGSDDPLHGRPDAHFENGGLGDVVDERPWLPPGQRPGHELLDRMEGRRPDRERGLRPGRRRG
jgi:hypothetical protein